MKHTFIELAGQFYNTPHLITPEKARILLGVFASRQGLQDLSLHSQNGVEYLAELKPDAAANAYVSGREARRLFPMLEGGIAVIHAEGTLVNKNGLNPSSGMTGYDGMIDKLQAARADDAVRGIAFDIDSSGGGVHGLFELCTEIRATRLEKPVWAFATDVAYSAAYAIAGSCDRFYLPETGGAGSIGTLMMHADFSRHLEAEGITVTLLHAGARKVDGNPYQPLPDAVQARLNEELQTVRGIFAGTLEAAGRISAKDALATEAQTYMGAAAVAAGLADGVMAPRQGLSAFQEFLDGSNTVVMPAASAALLQPQEDTKMTGSRVPQAGASRGVRASQDENKEAMDDEETPSAAEEEEVPEAAEDDDEPASSEDDEDVSAEGEDDEADAEDDDDNPQASGNIDAGNAQAIVNSEAAASLPNLAQALAFGGVDRRQAEAFLKAAQKDVSATGGSLRQHMKSVDQPNLGSGAPAPSAGASDVDQIMSDYYAAHGIKS